MPSPGEGRREGSRRSYLPSALSRVDGPRERGRRRSYVGLRGRRQSLAMVPLVVVLVVVVPFAALGEAPEAAGLSIAGRKAPVVVERAVVAKHRIETLAAAARRSVALRLPGARR